MSGFVKSFDNSKHMPSLLNDDEFLTKNNKICNSNKVCNSI